MERIMWRTDTVTPTIPFPPRIAPPRGFTRLHAAHLRCLLGSSASLGTGPLAPIRIAVACSRVPGATEFSRHLPFENKCVKYRDQAVHKASRVGHGAAASVAGMARRSVPDVAVLGVAVARSPFRPFRPFRRSARPGRGPPRAAGAGGKVPVRPPGWIASRRVHRAGHRVGHRAGRPGLNPGRGRAAGPGPGHCARSGAATAWEVAAQAGQANSLYGDLISGIRAGLVRAGPGRVWSGAVS